MAMFDPYFVVEKMNEVLARYGAGCELKITLKETPETPPPEGKKPA